MSWRILLPTLWASLLGICGVGADASGPRTDAPAFESGAAALGISFIEGSTSTLRVERNGTRYVVDLVARTVRVASPEGGGADPRGAAAAAPSQATGKQSEGAAIFARECSPCHGPDGKGIKAVGTPDFTDPKTQARLTDELILATIRNGKKGTLMPAWSKKLSNQQVLQVAAYVRSLGSRNEPPPSTGAQAAEAVERPGVYKPGDDSLFSLPTGRPLDRHGFYINFSHRFAYDPAFSGTARGSALFGLEGFSLSSLGVRYGVTSKFSISAYRSPTFIARPIQLMAAYNFLSESNRAPLNLAVRFSVEGQDSFSKNFTENFELVLSRSVTHRAQLYAVPTLSLNSHRLFSPNSYRSSAIPNLPGFNTFSLGLGGSLDVRPTVALVAEAIPTLVNGRPLGIHRPEIGFGIQKKIWRHAFTLGLTNSPGTTVSQRAGSRAAFLGDPSGDTFKNLFVGFDLTRQIH
jgi:mono/diheme cytochrome c family protein